MLLSWIKGVNASDAPTGLEMALHSQDPKSDGSGGGEITGTGYARQVFELGNSTTNLIDGTSAFNSDDIIFGPALSIWGAVTHYLLRDSTTGVIVLHGEFTVPKPIGIGDAYTITSGKILLTIS